MYYYSIYEELCLQMQDKITFHALHVELIFGTITVHFKDYNSKEYSLFPWVSVCVAKRTVLQHCAIVLDAL